MHNELMMDSAMNQDPNDQTNVASHVPEEIDGAEVIAPEESSEGEPS